MFDENNVGIQIIPYSEPYCRKKVNKVIFKVGNCQNILCKDTVTIGIIIDTIEFLKIGDNSNIGIHNSLLYSLLIELGKEECCSTIKKVEINLNKIQPQCITELSNLLENNNTLTTFELKCNGSYLYPCLGFKNILIKTSLQKIVLNCNMKLVHIVSYFSSTKYPDLTTLDLSHSFDRDTEADLSTSAQQFINILLNVMPSLKHFIYDGNKDFKKILLQNFLSVNDHNIYLKFISILYPDSSSQYNQQDPEQKVIDLTEESSTIYSQSKCDINDISDITTSLPYQSFPSNYNNIEASTSTSSNYMNTLDLYNDIPSYHPPPYHSNCNLSVTSNISSKESDNLLLLGEDSSDRSLVIDEERCE
ncbi:hypothetical protein [Orientia tsutsugamushi]|uniref:hypothetical protein n=1 Tax=Orientia tsutsugamushi TaxID=784 RepID=UPI000D5A475E|nr:Uncharacterised protein [Orientia tsutsugamushi]